MRTVPNGYLQLYYHPKTEDEIINAFGKEILSLVKSESEDKSKS